MAALSCVICVTHICGVIFGAYLVGRPAATRKLARRKPMTTTLNASFTAADLLGLKAMGEAIFTEWYPHWRDGDPVPALPPLNLANEARKLALQHRMVAARQRGKLDHHETVQQKIDSINRRLTR
jgi:hypothetical protein